MNYYFFNLCWVSYRLLLLLLLLLLVVVVVVVVLSVCTHSTAPLILNVHLMNYLV